MIKTHTFLDIDHPVVAWGAYRGILVSANAEYQPPICPVSMMFAGMILHQNNSRLHNELLIEKHRQAKYPQCVSRLTGMYFFEDLRNAQSVTTNPEWSGGYFNLENLAEIELFPTAEPSRHDSNWISYAKLDSAGKITEQNWLDDYWQGKPYPHQDPIWELIANGRAVICGTDLRKKAYSKLKRSFPESVAILEIARIAAEVGSDLGQATAWITRPDETLNLSFHLDMRDAENPVFLEKVKNYQGPRNHQDLSVGGEFFSTPDFTKFCCQFTPAMNIENDFLYSVHHNTLP